MSETDCNKGPVLDQLLSSVSELKSDQRRMVDALVDIAKHQERLVALADRTEENRVDIGQLAQQHRESESLLYEHLRDVDNKIISHMLNHPNPDTCRLSKALTPNNDGKFDKVQVAVILALTYFLAGEAWKLLSGLVQSVKALGGQA